MVVILTLTLGHCVLQGDAHHDSLCAGDVVVPECGQADTSTRIFPSAPWKSGVERVRPVEIDGTAFELFGEMVKGGE